MHWLVTPTSHFRRTQLTREPHLLLAQISQISPTRTHKRSLLIEMFSAHFHHFQALKALSWSCDYHHAVTRNYTLLFQAMCPTFGRDSGHRTLLRTPLHQFEPGFVRARELRHPGNAGASASPSLTTWMQSSRVCPFSGRQMARRRSEFHGLSA